MQPGRFRSVIILCHDAALSGAVFVLALILHMGVPPGPATVETAIIRMPVLVITAGLTFYLCGLHRRVWSYTSIADLLAIAKASSWLIAALAALALVVDGAGTVPAPVLLIQWFMMIVMLGASRLAYRLAGSIPLPGVDLPASAGETPVLVYGCGPMTPLFLQAVQSAPHSGLRVVGVLDETGERVGRTVVNAPVLGRACDLDRVLIDLAVQGVAPRRVVVTTDPATMEQAARAELEAARVRHGLHIDDLSESLSIMSAPPPARQPRVIVPPSVYARFRRCLDIAVGALGLLLLSPVLALVALGVACDLGRPILFRQTRPGRHLRPFILYKFRTMRLVYDEFGGVLPDPQRTTALGRLLRRTRLDELPQLINVLSGEMSLIGPRPLLHRDLPPECAQRAAVRPGLTGWAQVNGGHRLAAADKLALDLWYVKNAGPRLDARIVRATLATVLFGETIHHANLALARAAAVLVERRDDDGMAPPGGRPASDPPVVRERPQLLIVNRYFHPDCSSTAQLLTDLVEALDRRGCPIRVFTGRRRYDDPATLLPARDRFGGAEVRRLRTSHFGRSGLLGRTLDDASFYAGAFCALLGSARRGDVLLVETDPPLMPAITWLVARLRGAKAINWCQDLFPETAAALGIGLARGPSGQLLRRARNRSLQDAAMNVALCSGMAEHLRAEGVPAGRITIIHNWADGEHIRGFSAERNPLRREWDLAGRFVLGYSGNLGRVHDAHALIALMDALKDEPDLLTLFIGAGNGYRALRGIFAEQGIANVRFRPYQPRERLCLSLTVPDLHLVSLKPECEGLVMPSKLYGILAAGRPIAFIGDEEGDAARLVRTHDAGLVAAPGRIAELAAEIRALRAAPDRLARLGANARRAYETGFSKEASLDAWLACLAALGTPCAPHVRHPALARAGDVAAGREMVAAP